MAETQLDVRGMAKSEAYRILQGQLVAVCEGVTDPVAIMSTMACLLHHGFGHLWTGFYRRVDSGTLIVGPYQGTMGCMEIEPGRGVCGAAARSGRTVIVNDVRQFAGHIACDPRSLSEIVVPVLDHRGEVTAVLDIDSAVTDAFDEDDRKGLEAMVVWFAKQAASTHEAPL